MSKVKYFLNIFFLTITILALVIAPYGMYLNYTSGRLNVFLLIVQLLFWIAFSVYTIMFVKRLVRTSK